MTKQYKRKIVVPNKIDQEMLEADFYMQKYLQSLHPQRSCSWRIQIIYFVNSGVLSLYFQSFLPIILTLGSLGCVVYFKNFIEKQI